VPLGGAAILAGTRPASDLRVCGRAHVPCSAIQRVQRTVRSSRSRHHRRSASDIFQLERWRDGRERLTGSAGKNSLP